MRLTTLTAAALTLPLVAVYANPASALGIETQKLVKGRDENSRPGPTLTVGDPVVFVSYLPTTRIPAPARRSSSSSCAGVSHTWTL